MAYKTNDPCLQKAYDDEKIFVLMARDINAPITVVEWIKQSFWDQPDEKLREAFDCALEMKNTLIKINLRKQQDESNTTMP